MADPTYNTRVYLEQGGARIVLEGGGVLVVDGVPYSGAELKALLAILAGLPAENVPSPAIWSDGGVLKVGTLGD